MEKEQSPMLAEGGKEIIKIRVQNKWNRDQKITVEKINGTKIWFFEKISNIHKLLARLIKKEGERTQIRSERGKVI